MLSFRNSWNYDPQVLGSITETLMTSGLEMVAYPAIFSMHNVYTRVSYEALDVSCTPTRVSSYTEGEQPSRKKAKKSR